MTSPLLRVRNLRVEFPTRRATLRAIDDISFDIMPGEVLGVVGEAGAGKSVTGAAIIGLIDAPGRIVGGEILLDGQRIDQLPPAAMRSIRGLSPSSGTRLRAISPRSRHRSAPKAPSGWKSRFRP